MRHAVLALALLVSIAPLAAWGDAPTGHPAPLLAIAGAGIVPTDADRTVFERGTLRQRTINIFLEPHFCGIVLLRATCAIVLPPQLSSFARSGDRDLIDPKWYETYIHAIAPPDNARWRDDPHGAWLETAATVYQVSYWPEGGARDDLLIPELKDLAANAADAGPYRALVPSHLQGHGGNLSPAVAANFQQELLPHLTALLAVTADPKVRRVDGLRGDMLRGAYLSTANEMFESTMLFLSPQSRAFFHDLCIALADNTPDSAGAAKTRQLAVGFLIAQGPQAWQEQRRQFQESLPTWTIRPLPAARRDAVLYGTFAAQIAYNAAVLRESKPMGEQLYSLRSFSGPDTGYPDLKPLRDSVLAVTPGDWKTMNERATVLTLAIAAP